MTIKASHIRKLNGSHWKTGFSSQDIQTIFDECGPLESIYHLGFFNFAWLVEKIFNDDRGRPLQLLEFQQVILQTLWYKKFPMLIVSRGGSKTFLLAVYALLRAILIPGSKIVICGAGFRQAKLVFKNIESLYEASPIIKEAIQHLGGPKYGSDMAYMKVGLSTIQAIPIGDGEKIRGIRASCVLADEFSCLDKDTIVETTNGLIRISDFDRMEGKLITGDNSLPFEKPTKFIKTPLCDVYEIKLSNGYKIKCSENHKLYTNNGWKKPLDISIGSDWIECNNHYKFPSRSPPELTKDLAWLMGILVSEGSINKDSLIQITTTSEKLSNKLCNEYGFKVKEKDAYMDPRGWSCKKSYKLHLSNKIFRDKLFELGLDYCTSHDKKIPWSILKADKETVLSFLSGLFDGDGSCFLFRDKRSQLDFIGCAYYSVSERLCRDVQILINKLGFDGYINKRKSKISNLDQWFFRLNGNNAYNFASLLGVSRFEYALKNCYLPDIPTNITFDKTRNKFKVQIRHQGKTLQKRFETRDASIALIESLDKYHRVISVIRLKKQDYLYDYYLPKTHSFYGDCFRQHNSIPEEIFDIVISPFTAAQANPSEKVANKRFIKRLEKLGAPASLITAIELTQGFGNQIVMSGTPSYKYNHFYKRYCIYKSFINSKGDPKLLKRALEERQLTTSGRAAEITENDLKNADRIWKQYAIVQLPYTAIPEGFLDEDNIRSDKATFPRHRFQMEYEAQFPDDTNGFIRRSWIDRATPKGPDQIPVFTELYGDPRSTYVMGLDPARWNDNFGCIVLKLTPRGKELVYCNAWDKTEFSVSAQKIREIIKRFNISYIAMDVGGGGEQVREWLCKKVDGVMPEDFIWVIPDQLEKYTGNKTGMAAPGKKILEMVDFSSNWISQAAHSVASDIEQCNILFPHRADSEIIYNQYMQHFGLQSISDPEKEKLQQDLWGIDEWEAGQLKKKASMGTMQHIEECIDETCAITRMVTPKGAESFELPKLSEQREGLDMRRRDRWSALMLANYAAKIYLGTGHKVNSSITVPQHSRGYTASKTHRRGSVAY